MAQNLTTAQKVAVKEMGFLPESHNFFISIFGRKQLAAECGGFFCCCCSKEIPKCDKTQTANIKNTLAFTDVLIAGSKSLTTQSTWLACISQFLLEYLFRHQREDHPREKTVRAQLRKLQRVRGKGESSIPVPDHCCSCQEGFSR